MDGLETKDRSETIRVDVLRCLCLPLSGLLVFLHSLRDHVGSREEFLDALQGLVS